MPCGPRARLTADVAYQTLAFAERDVLLAAPGRRRRTAASKRRPQGPTPLIPCQYWIQIVGVVGGAAMVVRREYLAMGFGDLGFVLTDGAYVPLVPSDARSPATSPDPAHLLRARESDTARGARPPPLRASVQRTSSQDGSVTDPRQILSWRTLWQR